jgi:hypothetical protein
VSPLVSVGAARIGIWHRSRQVPPQVVKNRITLIGPVPVVLSAMPDFVIEPSGTHFIRKKNRHRGTGRPASPATPPDMRVRIRRFGGLS